MFELREVTRLYGLERHGRGGRAQLRAVDGVSLELLPGETLALVGESGCGKSTLARLMLGLEAPSAGEVRYRGASLAEMSRTQLRHFRREVQLVFQDPYGSLNPRLTVRQIVGEGMVIHKLAPRAARRGRVDQLLAQVGLTPEAADRHPQAFSGGQRQRIGIARALAVSPCVLVADEPVSALDVSIQAQVLNLLAELKKQHDLTYLFISHDLRVVEHISDRVAVMYLGKIVEVGPTEDVYRAPLHPYTRALLKAVPSPIPGQDTLEDTLQGEVPSPLSPPSGCAFHPRCPERVEPCPSQEPLATCPKPEHLVRCHLYR